MKKFILSLIIFLLIALFLGCMSNPYVVKTTIDRDKGQQIDRVCTHKTAFIPWYAVVAAGVFSFKYGEQCSDEVKKINDLVSDDDKTTTTKSLEKKKAMEEKRQEIEKAALEAKNDSRFIDNGNGTVTDTKTGLVWAARDNGNNIKWADAKSYCENYHGGGYTDWRMPTQDELAGLYDAGKARPAACDQSSTIRVATDLIGVTCLYIWASETRMHLLLVPNAAYFSFYDNGRYWCRPSGSDFLRAFPVRSVK
jgi:hypothetical protein